MLIKKIHLKNIRSYVDEEINFPEGSLLLSGDVGSGKSTILLSIDFALFGTRKGEISGSELLRHGSNNGSVELLFSLGSKNIYIKRTLKRTKNIVQDSGFLEVNGIREEFTPTELKARIMELFGYPKNRKESIFRYTVYTPQEEMKQILFSKPEERLQILRKIFGVDKYGIIKENAKTIAREFRTIKREYTSFISDMPEKQKEKKEKTELIVKIEKEKKSISENLNMVDNKISDINNKIKESEKKIKEIFEQRRTLAKLESDLSGKKSRYEYMAKNIENLIQRSRSYSQEYEKYKNLEKPAKELSQLSLEIKNTDKEKSNLIASSAYLKNDISKMMAILEKGFCEVCGQSVHDKSSFESKIIDKKNENSKTESNLEKIIERLHILAEEQEKTIIFMKNSENKKNIEKSLLEIQTDTEKFNREIKIVENEIVEITKKIDTLRETTESYVSYEKENEKLRVLYDSMIKEKLFYEKQSSRIEQQLFDNQQRIIDLEKEIAEKIKYEEKISHISTLTTWLDDSFSELMDTMERHVMIVIQKEFDDYFKSWFSLVMGDEVLSVRIDESFSPVIEQNGFETEYNNLSGGEKTAVALAYRLSLNKVINALVDSIKTRDLLILDEPTDGFSSSQLDRIRYIIDELNLKQVILVSHEPKIDTFVDNVIRVYKQNHISKTG